MLWQWYFEITAIDSEVIEALQHYNKGAEIIKEINETNKRIFHWINEL